MTYLWQKNDFSPADLERISRSRTTLDLEAMTTLGLFHAYGTHGYRQSSDEATRILNDAMAKKHAQAFFVYGKLVAQDFFKGKKDITKSVAYLKKSAELGFDLAMAKLGDYYLEGKGVKKSYRDAEKWLTKARHQSAIPGLNHLIEVYTNLGYLDKVEELQQLVSRYINIKPYKI